MQLRAYLVTRCKHDPHRRHATPLDTLMRTASAGDQSITRQLSILEAFADIRNIELESDLPDPYAAGIFALQQEQQQRATVNPSPLFQMAAERDRRANAARAAFEKRYKAERLAALEAEHTRHAESNSLTPSELLRYAAPDPYAAGIKALRERMK